MAEALRELGAERALVVHGEDGLDEVSPAGPSRVAKVWQGAVEEGLLSPQDFGLAPSHPESLKPGADVAESATILSEAVSVSSSPRCAAVLPSASAALWLAGVAQDLPSGAQMAKEAVASGAAKQKLEHLIEATQAK
jgi:anthranilate phosphoribosyltransferase